MEEAAEPLIPRRDESDRRIQGPASSHPAGASRSRPRPASPDRRGARDRRRNAATVSLVIPTLNEANNIAWVLQRIPVSVDEVILVDGRSTDGTVEVARGVRPDIRVVIEPRPGKGVALRSGFGAARGDYIVMIDADGSMDPREIEDLVQALEDRRRPAHPGRHEFVKGSRFAEGGGSSDISFVRRAGNDALRRLVNTLYGVEFTDLCYGLCAFRRDGLDALCLRSEGFEIETEISVRAIKAGLRIGEVASYESERLNGTSNLSAWRDGRRVLRTLFRERFAMETLVRERATAAASRALAVADGELAHAAGDARMQLRA